MTGKTKNTIAGRWISYVTVYTNMYARNNNANAKW